MSLQQMASQLTKVMQEQNALATDKGYRDSVGHHSQIGIAMRKKAKITTHNLKDEFQITYNKNIIKLSFLLLIFMFTQDDDQIDKKEDKAINKMIKDYTKELDTTELQEIINFTKDSPNERYVLDYMSKNKIKLELFNQSVTLINKHIKKDDAYRKLLRSIKELGEFQ